MAWLQLVIKTNVDQANTLSDILSDAGASAVTLRDAADQPLYEPPIGETPLWHDTEVIGLFDSNTDIDQVLLIITSKFEHCPAYTLNPLEDKDWVREWMSHFKPTLFGKRLWIVPSHHAEQHISQQKMNKDTSSINILLDPGLAFGTGTHPTTAMCLEYLEQADLMQKMLIDYGCGSGILAIAAAKLGATSILAIDNDPQAVLATKDNAIKNTVEDCFTIQLPEPTLKAPPSFQADVLVANILAQPLIELAPHISKYVKPQGNIALSGILNEQADAVIDTYSAFFEIKVWKKQDDWVCLAGTKKA